MKIKNNLTIDFDVLFDALLQPLNTQTPQSVYHTASGWDKYRNNFDNFMADVISVTYGIYISPENKMFMEIKKDFTNLFLIHKIFVNEDFEGHLPIFAKKDEDKLALFIPKYFGQRDEKEEYLTNY